MSSITDELKQPHHKNRYYSYLNSAVQVLKTYKADMPFTAFLNRYFADNRKMGGRDRKQVSRLCYAFFRLGKAAPGMAMEQRVLTGLACCVSDPEEEWKQILQEYEVQKGEYPQEVFPWQDALSRGIGVVDFESSFFTQPDLFLRIRPGYEKSVPKKLKAADISFTVREDVVRLPNAVNIGGVLKLNREAVVQDMSSQATGQLMRLAKDLMQTDEAVTVWDCCAGSGGKSILAADIFEKLRLSVSDIRDSILINLQKRFKEAGVHTYKTFTSDLLDSAQVPNEKFDFVIADLPCSGSGTWSRTPEQLYYFDYEKIEAFASLQSRILKNVISCVKPGGLLLYITCSVFEKENEDQVSLLAENGFSLVEQSLFAGYQEKADTLFAALLQKQYS